MNEALKTVLSLSLSGSLLMFILFLLRPVVKERLSKRWQYYIWLVVIARLMLPFAPEENLMETLFQRIDPAIGQEQGSMTDRQNSLYREQTAPVESTSGLIQNAAATIWNHLWLVWFVVALLLFIRKITIYQGFVKYIRAGCTEVTDIDLLERFGNLVEKSKIRCAVELHTNSLIASPLLIGFFRPCIVLPSAKLSPVDFKYTILHELTHYKRRDMFYKWLVQLTVCTHWFNPFIFFMSRAMDQACELSCDEAVIRTLEPHERRAYGDTLLNAMAAGGSYKNSLASVTLGESKERLKERLDAIMGFKKTTRLATAVSLGLVFSLSIGATVLGAYAASPDEKGTVVINLSNEGKKNIMHSSGFEAQSGQVLILEIQSSIKGATDLFLFSPSKQEQRITIEGHNETKVIPLSEGRWEYNCTGFFDSGDISIVGTVSSTPPAEIKETPAAPNTAEPNLDGAVVMDLSNGNQTCLVHSSSFQAQFGQVLILEIQSSIDGTVDLFLFSPSNQEQHIVIGGNDETIIIPLSEGRWAYNCTGFFDRGDISMVGTLSSEPPTETTTETE